MAEGEGIGGHVAVPLSVERGAYSLPSWEHGPVTGRPPGPLCTVLVSSRTWGDDSVAHRRGERSEEDVALRARSVGPTMES
ncbi:hypothetical protein SZMC14600_18689 [Saccharomonospora azurea SZMC 14600]|nr:hypothetical protein SZMC14600_18689 [Saccharomonospora azurea SZMC 14600]